MHIHGIPRGRGQIPSCSTAPYETLSGHGTNAIALELSDGDDAPQAAGMVKNRLGWRAIIKDRPPVGDVAGRRFWPTCRSATQEGGGLAPAWFTVFRHDTLN